MLYWSGGGRRTAWPVMPRAVLRAECFWNSEKRHHSLRDSLFWTYLSHLLALNQSPSLVSMPYSLERVAIPIYVKCKLWSFSQLNTTSGSPQTVWRWQELVWIPKLLCLALLSPPVKCCATFQTCARWLNSFACMAQPCGDCQYQDNERCT